ncbi:hypothetical protein JJB97_00005 [Enterobacterales bacterium BIT-L3]|jgi:uncharacterized membrane protein YfcA|uniref:Uncharacterized protein n=2 Tax=Tenebrionibacter/Tenebrionicola group TaxID=2969848 RepID=A0A8K0V443_9ENTR|nr:hypothetical protein [Tenebrionibacter intestinalis]MBV5094621.1 hypothetical protein [Tenebrionicola larvae]
MAVTQRKELEIGGGMILFSFAGIPVGLYAQAYMPDHMMKIGLGAFIITVFQ